MTDRNKVPVEEEPSIVTGSLILGLVMSVATIALLARFGHTGWAWGFGVGAGLSLISLFSLGTLVPRLMMPTATTASQFLLALVLFMKLPLYAGALYALTRTHPADAGSAFPGILVAPAAITAKTVGALIWKSIADAVQRRRIRRGGLVIDGRAQGKRTLAVEPMSE